MVLSWRLLNGNCLCQAALLAGASRGGNGKSKPLDLFETD
jgi:hypothetical protein